MTQIRRQRHRFPVEVEQAAEEMLGNGLRPAEVVEELRARYGERAPSRSTVEDWKARLRLPAVWTLDPDEPDGARLVLEVMAAEGQAVTAEDAKWIIAIRRAAPDLPIGLAYPLAKQYQSRHVNGTGTYDLDVFLAGREWDQVDESLVRVGLLRGAVLDEDVTDQAVELVPLRKRPERIRE